MTLLFGGDKRVIKPSILRQGLIVKLGGAKSGVFMWSGEVRRIRERLARLRETYDEQIAAGLSVRRGR